MLKQPQYKFTVKVRFYSGQVDTLTTTCESLYLSDETESLKGIIHYNSYFVAFKVNDYKIIKQEPIK